MNLFGPVLPYDVMRQARRGRYFQLRCLYGILVLIVLAITYTTTVGRWDGRANTADLPYFAEKFFGAYLILQFLAVLALTPAYVAGAVAEEKETRTLDFVLTTSLLDREIIYGKLAARLAHLTLLLLTGFPIISLMQLFGGIDPLYLWGGFALTFSTMLAVGGIAIYNSVVMKKPNEALTATYSSCFLLGFVFYLLAPSVGSSFGWGPILGLVFLMVSQLWIAWLFSTLAVRDLRRVYARQAFGKDIYTDVSMAPAVSGVGQRPGVASNRGVGTPRPPVPSSRPPVGDNAMLWKELHLRKGKLVSRGALIGVGLTVTVFLWILLSMGLMDTQVINGFVRMTSSVVGFFALATVGGEAVRSIWIEREKQRIESLLVTPLTLEEILQAKLLGSMASPRGAYGGLAIIWSVGVLTGGLTLLALPLLPLILGVFAALMAVMGLLVGIRAGTAGRAQFWTTVFVMMVLCGAPFWCICSGPWMGGLGRDFQLSLSLALTPLAVLGGAAFHGYEFRSAVAGHNIVTVVVVAIIGSMIYSIVALMLWKMALTNYRRVCGRVDDQPRPTRPPKDRP